MAATTVRHGRASLAHGIHLLDQDWAHIQHWQAFSAQHCADDANWTRLCKEFPLEGQEILSIRQHPAERVLWLETALDAAEQLNDVKAQCDLLFQLFTASFALSNLNGAETYMQRLANLADAAGDHLNAARAVYAQACIHEERGQYAEARTCYQQSQKDFERLHADNDLSMALHGLGSIEIYTGQSEEALRYFLRHLALAEAAGQESDICRALLAVAEGYWGMEDFSTAEDYARRAITLSRVLGYQGMLAGGLIALGGYAIERQDMNAAIAPLEEGVQIARHLGSQRQLIHGLAGLGYVWFRLAHYDKALAHFDEALSLARAAGLPRFICNALRHRINTYLALGDLDTAQCALREGMQLAISLESDLQKRRNLSAAVMLWYHKGDLEPAARWAGILDGSTDIDMPVYEPVREAVEAALGREHYRQLFEEGKTMTLDEAVSAIYLVLR
jgi:tetratricopeptide (TPR) repeat protein